MLSTSSVGLPSDIWTPTSALLKPAVMHQLAASYEHNIANGDYTFTAEVYARRTNHVADFRVDADIFQNPYIENEIETGYDRSCGLELFFARNKGPLTGWASYTLSTTRRHIGNQTYRPTYERPHALRLFLNWQANARWSLSSTFTYTSGMNLTMPIGRYISGNMLCFIYSERNGYRAPAFHQLDFSAKRRINQKQTLTFSIINAYNRKNVFSIYAGRDDWAARYMRVYKLYLHGIVPSIAYSIRF